ncbi:hypothetical protein AB5N19_12676 [Seiridium cardinale]
MTSVVPADRAPVIQQKREACGSIRQSRKRKLQELYAVATILNGLPNFGAGQFDAPPPNAAEVKFLEANDILKGRKLNELNIPPRPKFPSDAFRQPNQTTPAPTKENAGTPSTQTVVKDGPHLSKSGPNAADRVAPSDGQQSASSTIVQPEAPSTSSPIVPTPTVRPQSSLPLQPSQPTQPAQPAPARDSITAVQSRQPGRQQTPSQTLLGAEVGGSAQLRKTATADRSPTQAPASVLPKTAGSTQTPDVPAHEALQNLKTPSPSALKEDGSAVQVPVRMDVHGSPAHESRNLGGLSLNAAQEPTRPADALSSPSSTTHTVTTPAVLETSTNTSPERDGMRLEERPAPFKPQHQQSQESRTSAQNGFLGSTTKEVEAQLLRDSASAASIENGQTKGSTQPTSTDAPIEAVKEMDIDPTTNTVDGPKEPHPDTAKNVHIQAPASPTPEKQSDKTEVEAVTATRERKASESQLLEPTQTQTAAGGIRQKSVSEVLSGESSKELLVPQQLKPDLRSQIPITPTSQSPRPRGRSFTEKSLKEKSRLAGVIFAKQTQKTSDSDRSLVHARSKSTGHVPTDDYFTPLFIQGFSNGTKWMKPLEQILHHAHKTVSTPDAYLHINENQACRVLKRVYNLQQQDKWSLRQPKRYPEPTRQTSQWDVLLQEMKWMRTDFRQEKKWKVAAARNLAHACAEWIAYPEERSELQVNAVAPPFPRRAQWSGSDLVLFDQYVAPPKENGEGSNGADHHETPDLISSADTDSPLDHDDEPNDHFLDTISPSAIFTLDDHEVVFGLNPSPHTDRLLEELPLYGAPLKVPDSDIVAPKHDPDAHWKREALPLSKYVEGRMELVSNEPPRKRSRYQYVQEDGDEEALFDQPRSASQLEPQTPDVALFQADNKAMRDRLHAGHQFRPPSEHTMPFQTFYESRSCSQWTVSEDDELKSLVREYSYNWSLIASILSTKSVFASGAERRTPWECFERWVMLEGLPHDMQKTQYFKLWQNRIEQAQQVIRQHNANALTQQAQQQQQQQQQQQAGTNGPVTPLIRKRLSLPVKVERRRNQKHLTMIDAMRKLAKKREGAVQKQQHAANLAQMRKQQEQPQPRAGPIKTPREYSIMRWERDQAMAERLAERMAQHQQQRLEAQRRVRANTNASSNNANPQLQAALQARAQQGQAAQMVNGQTSQPAQNPQQLGATHPLAGVNRINPGNQMAVNGQARPRIPMQGTPTGNGSQGPIAGGLVPPMQMNGNGQVQMPVVNGQARMTIPTQPDLNLVLQAQRISEQQRQAVQMRQAQQQTHTPQQGSPALQNSPPAAMRAAVANGVNQKNYMNNAQAQAIMAQFNGAANSGLSTPPASGLNMPAGQSGSPRPNTTMTPQIHQTYVSQLQHIESQIRQSHPNTPQDVVRQMATQLLQNRHNNMANNLAQSAMSAAAGGQGQAIANGPHQYAQLLRAQQQAQAQAAAAANAQQQAQQHHQRNSSGGSATPPVPTMPK